MEKNIPVSIIIPTYNSSRILRRCLDSIWNNNYKNIHVYVCDDGSIEEESREMEKITTNYGYTFIKCFHAGPGNARNAGINTAEEGSLIYFLDSDTRILPNTITTHVQKQMENEFLVATFGGIIYEGKQNIVSEFFEKSKLFVEFQKESESIKWCVTNNLMINKKKLGKIRFDYYFGFGSEDVDFCLRLRNVTPIIQINALAKHLRHNSFIKGISRSYHYSKGSVMIAQKYPHYGYFSWSLFLKLLSFFLIFSLSFVSMNVFPLILFLVLYLCFRIVNEMKYIPISNIPLLAFSSIYFPLLQIAKEMGLIFGNIIKHRNPFFNSHFFITDKNNLLERDISIGLHFVLISIVVVLVAIL